MTDATTPEQQQPETPAPSPTTDDLAQLFAEFDAATKPKEQPKPQANPSKPEPAQSASAEYKAPNADFMAEVDKALGAFGMTSELRNHLQNYATTVHALQAEHLHQRDKADFEKVVSRFDKEARDRGYFIGEDYARMWLKAESVTNPQLVAVLDHRYDSADNARLADRLIQKAQDRFLASAKREPDPQATADRAAVTWAVRNTSSVTPPERPVRYGDLTDAEFNAELKKLGIG